MLATEEPVAAVCFTGRYPDWAGRQREGDAVGGGRDEVVIYWRPDCMFCLGLLLRLRRTRLRYRKVDIREDRGAKAFVRSVADGNETVPTVVVAGRALVNPSKRQVLGAVRAYAPHALGDGRLRCTGTWAARVPAGLEQSRAEGEHWLRIVRRAEVPAVAKPGDVEAAAAVHAAGAQGDLAVRVVRAARLSLR